SRGTAAETQHRDAHRRAFDGPGLIAPRCEEAAGIGDRIKNPPVCTTPDRVSADQPDALRTARCDRGPRLGDPVSDEVRLLRDAARVGCEQGFDVAITEFRSQALSP